MRAIRRRISEEGPLMARDFEQRASPNSGWWDWKPAKIALEQMFMEGDLMVVGRQGFQKIYDLTERVLPAAIDTNPPDIHEQARYFIDTTIRAHGFAALKSFTYLRKGKTLRDSVKEQLNQRVLDKELKEAFLPCGTHVFTDTGLATRKRVGEEVVILSPFDNCVIQRERCRRIFDFDYQIECYLPADKRKYGYFSLPLLFADQFVGRMDCKAERKKGVLNIKSLHMHSNASETVYRGLASSLREYAEFNHCADINIQCNTASGKRLAAYVL